MFIPQLTKLYNTHGHLSEWMGGVRKEKERRGEKIYPSEKALSRRPHGGHGGRPRRTWPRADLAEIPRKHWENTLVELYSRRKNSRSTQHSARKKTRSSNIRTEKTSLIQDFAHPKTRSSNIRTKKTSLIQDFAHPKTLSKHLVEVRNRRNQGSPKS